jgi:hypothetical protein
MRVDPIYLINGLNKPKNKLITKMAAPYGYQRALGGEVRDLTLKEIKNILLDTEYKLYGKEFRQQVILRLAGSALPRINEVSGQDGEPLQIKVIFPNAGKDNNTTQLARDSYLGNAEI